MNILAALKEIKDNPYQGRQAVQRDDIILLGRSIAVDGLQEIPKARANGKGYHLKFGHRRRAAFAWLKENWQAENLPDRYNGYTVMPLDIEELTDEEMYRGAVIENELRKDLNPIERAKMMLVYRDQFKKSSDEIGALFGMNGSTVRGLIRLLELPESVQDKVVSGEISQGSARSLLTIARVDEKQVKKAADAIAAGSSAEDVIAQSMRDSDSTITMWQSWNDGKPRGGEGLWPLEMKAEKFPMSHLPLLSAEYVAKALDMELTETNRFVIENWIPLIHDHPDKASEYASAPENSEDASLIERIAHLLFPPACAACPFHASSDRSHYCGFKACHARKRTAWVTDEMQKISKKLSIAIYNPVTDGKAFIPLHEHHSPNTKMVSDQNADLRLQPHKNEYSKHKWTESNFCRVIVVGKKAVVAKKEIHEGSTSQHVKEEAYRKERELQDALRDASQTFTRDYAVKLFGAAFKGLDNIPAMCALADVSTPKKTAKKAEVLADLRARLATDALDNLRGHDWELMRKGPSACAKYLQGVATTWGLKLPADFMDVAKGYAPAVAVETKKVAK